MIALPDFQVRKVCKEVADRMLTDAAMLAEMLEGLDPAERDSFRTALADRHEGQFRLGFGPEPPGDWSVVVALAGTDPQHTIGDLASPTYETPLKARTLSAEVGVAADAVVTFTNGVPNAPADVPLRGTLRLGGDDPEGVEYVIYRIDAGVCRLESRGILGTTAKVHPVGTEVLFYERVQRLGWPERVTLRLDVLGVDGEFVAILASIFRAYLLTAAKDFDAAGYTLQDMRASDLALYPVYWCMPSLTLTFQTALSVPERIPVIVDTDVTLTTEQEAAA